MPAGSRPPSPAPGSASLRNWTLVGLVLAAVPALIFPGDAPFINDEPFLLISAMRANEAHTLAVEGLTGNRGMPYGPLPTWIYQLLLAVTHDPVILVVTHAALLAAGTLVALYWLSRETRLWPPFAVVVALSPLVWFQDRQLWDNTFNIPICAMVLAAYAHFLARRSGGALALAVAGLVVAPFIHLMALALVIPVGLHMLFFERRALLQHALLVWPFPVFFLALSWKYLRVAVIRASAWGGIGSAHVSEAANGFAYPLLGGRFLSAMGFGDGWNRSALFGAARVVSAIAFPLVWAGMALAAWRILGVVRGRRTAEIQDHVAGIALAIVVAQSLADGLMKVAFHPHYFNATWIAYAVLAWLAADALVRADSRWWRALGWLVPVHAAALVIVDVILVASVRAAPGTHYGPTLDNQIEVAREVARYAPETPVTTDVWLYREFPHALTAMKRLLGPPPRAGAWARRLVIKRRSADPSDGHVVVVVE